MPARQPQTFDRLTASRLNLSVLACMVPVVVASIFLHGWYPGLLVVVGISSALIAEEILRRFRKSTDPRDFSIVNWGMFLVLLLPANAPWFLAILGPMIAVGLSRGVFGADTPWVNPVLISWAFLQVAWPGSFLGLTAMTTPSPWDVQSTEWLNTSVFSWLSIHLPAGYLDWMTGWGRPETALIGESSPILLLLGTVFLLARGLIPWRVPMAFFTVFVVILGLFDGNLIYQVFAGSFLLNLFFLSTDPTTRPLGIWSGLFFGVLAGLMAGLVRLWGGPGDAVGYAVLLANLFVPWFENRRRKRGLNDFRVA